MVLSFGDLEPVTNARISGKVWEDVDVSGDLTAPDFEFQHLIIQNQGQ